MRVIELLTTHRLMAIVRAVTAAAALGVDDPAAIELLVRQESSTPAAALSADTLPDAARISIQQPRLDGYAIADLKETNSALLDEHLRVLRLPTILANYARIAGVDGAKLSFL